MVPRHIDSDLRRMFFVFEVLACPSLDPMVLGGSLSIDSHLLEICKRVPLKFMRNEKSCKLKEIYMIPLKQNSQSWGFLRIWYQTTTAISMSLNFHPISKEISVVISYFFSELRNGCPAKHSETEENFVLEYNII